MADYPALHGPSRPDWNCLVCGAPWPCLTRKRQLKELCQCNIRTLVRYMTSYLPDAHTEITGMSTTDITERIVGWCGRPLEMWAVQEHPPTREIKSGTDATYPIERQGDMDATDNGPAQSRSEQAEAAEQEAARQRLLKQAEADRIPADDTTRAVPDRRWRRDHP
ncbi:hypothetical protein [Micromonospora sp. NBC_01412]|uniref:hypothetical protein n=1 Tax=Micromonospora sp. NBC_01412 TaxID=2903590 RepID=UPI00325511BA